MFSFIDSKYSNKCYKLVQNEWKEFANLKQKRAYAAGIVFEDHFHIFGGHDGGSALKSTEIIGANGVVIDGPDMPTVISGLAITNFNQTSSVLSGGRTYSGVTSKTWFYNHKTEKFSEGPALLQPRAAHASATLVDKHGIYIRTVRP